MGKAEYDFRVINDASPSGIERTVQLEMWDDISTGGDYADLKDAAHVSQAAFDLQAANQWNWYAGLTSEQKNLARNAFLAV